MDLSVAFCYSYCNYPHLQMRKKRHSKEGASEISVVRSVVLSVVRSLLSPQLSHSLSF